MTGENQTTSPGGAAAPSPGSSYQSLTALRDAHSDLRRSTSSSSDQPDSQSRERQIRAFLISASKTGAYITDARERRVAQSILDFWSADLAGSSKASSDNFVSALLAPFDATQTADEADKAATASIKDGQRTLVRLSAMARQWQDSGKQPGYLLTGETVAQAARFKYQNPNLEEFITASEDAERAKRRRKRNIAYASLTMSAMIGCVLILFVWQFYALPQRSNSWIREIKETTSGETQTNNLWWLKTFQPWLPPYDFSGTRKIANIRYPGLKLNAPNFSRIEFTNIKLPKAHLSSASFNGGLIHIDPEDRSADWNNFSWNDFSGAELKLTQFREAQIIATSFAGADLYRAVFDRALLCDVNFSNADLLSASFWGATLDDRTYGWLRKTAWWVAGGWNSGNLERLLNAEGQDQPDLKNQPVIFPPASSEEAQALRQALRNSDRFHKIIEGALAEARPGTFDRALALNDMAWTLTTWGIDAESLRTTPAPCDTKADPTDPLDAASEAICIVEDLKRKGGQDKDYDYWLANFRDTQAYILMQANRMPEARALYEKDSARTESDGGALFRYAITLFALGQESEAVEKFDAAIRQKQYLPSDELHNLKRYIPLNVRRMAYDAIDATYPAPKQVQSCPAEAKPN
jgi:uncharacterized protein YjbI with pentapeptide repeats